MLEKPFTVTSYVVIGLLIAFLPIAAQFRRTSGTGSLNVFAMITRLPDRLSFLITPASPLLSLSGHAGVNRLSFGASYDFIMGFSCGLAIGATLPWWQTTSSGFSLS